MGESVEMALDRIRWLAREIERENDSGTILDLSRELRRTTVALRDAVRRKRAMLDPERSFMWARLEDLEDESRRRRKRAEEAEAEVARLTEQVRIATEALELIAATNPSGERYPGACSTTAHDALIQMSVVE